MNKRIKYFGLNLMVLITILGCYNYTTDEEVDESISAPTNLIATSGAGSITLTWTPVSGFGQYAVFRTTNSAWTNYVRINTISSTTIYIDNSNDLQINTTYYYKVAVVNRGAIGEPVGKLSKSAEATFSSAPPGNITGISISALSSSSIKISWTALSKAEKYRIYRTTGSSNSIYETIAYVDAPSIEYTDTSLAARTTYYYRISAIDNNENEGTQSSWYSVTTMSITTPPENLSAAANGRVITLEWDAVEGASYYYIYLAFAEAGPYALINNFSTSLGTVYNVTTVTANTGVPLSASTTYFFKVSTSPDGEKSDFVSATTGA